MSVDILGQIFCYGGLSYALQKDKQRPWPLSTRTSITTSSYRTIQNVSRCFQMSLRVGATSPWSGTTCLQGLFRELYVNSSAPCLESLTSLTRGKLQESAFYQASVDLDASGSWTIWTHLFSLSFFQWSVVEMLLCDSCLNAWMILYQSLPIVGKRQRFFLALPLNASSQAWPICLSNRDTR